MLFLYSTERKLNKNKYVDEMKQMINQALRIYCQNKGQYVFKRPAEKKTHVYGKNTKTE